MSTHDELLARVIEAPDDIDARLVYADALAEAGMTARAELIVVSCELSRSPWRALERPDLHARCLELLHDHEADWLAPLAELGVLSAVYHDGLVEEVTVRARTFADRCAELFAIAPVRTVHLLGLEELRVREVAALLARPELARLDGIGLRGAQMTAALVAVVFASESAATRVRALDLSGTSWDVEALRAASNATPAAATQVSLSDPRGRATDASTLAVVGRVMGLVPNVERVRMAARAPDVAQLVTTIPLAKLRAVDLDVLGTPLRASACLRLCSPRAAALEELRLRGLESVEELVRWLPDAPFLEDLRALSLGDRGRWPGARVMGLVSLREAAALEELSLSGVSTGAALPAIVQHPARAALRALSLDACALGRASLEAIAASEPLAGLRRLELRRQHVPPDIERRLRARFGLGYRSTPQDQSRRSPSSDASRPSTNA